MPANESYAPARSFSVNILGILAVLVVLQGCTSGKVLDSHTGLALESVVVELVDGVCMGAACATGPARTYTDSYGWYIFDGYERATQQLLQPSPGQEAIALRISRDGFQPVMIFHRPAYRAIQVADTEYLATHAGTVYLCPLSSIDTDGDSVCDEAEARYGTDPQSNDTDGDSLSDAAELYGHDGVDLRYFGANPLRKDAFLEVDYFPGLKPESGALQKVVDAFAAAPLANPDGSTGIHLAIDLSDEIDAADADEDLSPAWQDLAPIKGKYFPARRAPLFRYCLFAHQHSSGMSSGFAQLPGHDFIVTLGAWSTPGGTLIQQAGTLMHELGHTFGLDHGGISGVNYQPNYLSVMSYSYQIWGLRVDGVDGVLDYSRLRIEGLDESALDEFEAMRPVSGSGTTEAELSRYGVFVRGWLQGTAASDLDFNRNAVIENAVQVDLDGDAGIDGRFSASHNDWEYLRFDGGGTIGDAVPGNARVFGQSVLSPEANSQQCMTEFEVEAQ